MYPREQIPRFGDQDLLGGVVGGEYRQGKLQEGRTYCLETVGTTTKLEVMARGKTVFMMIQDGDEGIGFAAERQMTAIYDTTGNLVEASLKVIDHLYRLSLAGRLVLPDDVIEKVKEMLASEVHWTVTMSLRPDKQVLIFNRTDIEATSVYELKFDGAASYYIPGTDWSLNVVRKGARVGFELDSVEGRNQTVWFNSFLNIEDLPTVDGIAGTRIRELVELAFPEYEELNSAKKKPGQDVDGWSN